MKIIAVDDERIALEGLLDVISEVAPAAELTGFEYPEDALAFVDEHECNIAFLDVEMAEMSGVELAEQLKMRNPDINIIFATGFEEYRKEAYDLHASGYLTKPITAENSPVINPATAATSAIKIGSAIGAANMQRRTIPTIFHALFSSFFFSCVAFSPFLPIKSSRI